MSKINLTNSFLCLLVKYIIFFFVLAFVDNRFKSTVLDNAETSSEIFKLTLGYILTVLFYTIPLILVFGFPLNYILKIKKGLYFIFSVIIFFIAEYCIYTYFYSSSNKINGIYNFIIGVVVLLLFFYRTIRIKFTEI